MDFFDIGGEIKHIGNLLETIRTLSKGHSTDYRQAPYDNDATLLQYILNDKIKALYDEIENSKGDI
jgi:hypothetical protein